MQGQPPKLQAKRYNKEHFHNHFPLLNSLNFQEWCISSIFSRLRLRPPLRLRRRIPLPPRPWRPGTTGTQIPDHSCLTRPKNGEEKLDDTRPLSGLAILCRGGQGCGARGNRGGSVTGGGRRGGERRDSRDSGNQEKLN